MRISTLIMAYILTYAVLMLAIAPWLFAASEALDTCQLKFSYETCAYSLR